VRRALRRLHRDERGQIVPLFILGVVSLVMLIVMLLNTGQEIVNRTEVQNAADAAAITQASWTARSLNVMAMNNVALTQSFALSAVSAVLNATAAEVMLRSARLAARYLREGTAACGTCWTGVGCVACAYYIAMGVHLGVAVIYPTVEIIDENWGVSSRFSDLAIAFSDMNDHIASSFPDFTDGIQRGIADENGVDPPLFYPPAQARGSNLSATPLPVEDGGLIEFPFFDPLGRLCNGGEEGTHRLLAIFDYFENFIEHGYPRGKGPYTIAKEDADRRISEPLAAIHDVHFEYRKSQRRGKDRFTRMLKALWPAMCVPRLTPTAGLPIPTPPSLSLYKVTVRPDMPNPVRRDREIRDGLSVLAFTRRQARAAVVPGRFANPPSATYAYAQAEVYTEQPAHDLFTQDWRARLVPAKLLERRTKEVVRAVEEFSTLHELLGSLSSDELRRVNAH